MSLKLLFRQMCSVQSHLNDETYFENVISKEFLLPLYYKFLKRWMH